MTTVTPRPGYYTVRLLGPHGIRTHLVSKDKTCSCGGSAKRQCRHIRAVKEYLEAGGERAPEGTVEVVRDSKPQEPPPDTCLICGASLSHRNNGYWRCSKDSSHYWYWRGEQNGGAIRKFLTEPHPAKMGAFYEMTPSQRRAFLERVRRRMLSGGYSPHNPGGNHNGQ